MITPELLKASGYVYRNAYDTPERFQERYGFNPLHFPQYFRLTKTGLVQALDFFCRSVSAHFAQSAAWTAMLTGRIAQPELVEGQEDNRG